jgi:hypothetical protein
VAASAGTTALPDVLYDPASAPTASVVDGPLADAEARVPDTELPWADSADSAPLELDQRANGADPDGTLDGLLVSDDDGQAGLATSSTTAGHAWAVKGASLTGPSTPAYMPRPKRARATARGAALETTVGASAASVDAYPAPAAAAVIGAAEAPGAYVPPLPAAVIPAGPPAPARAWAGYAADADRDAPGTAGAATLKAPAMDPSRLAEFIGSVSVAGAALAAVGFLLPWASVMIGSSGAGYFDRWGLAGPSHIVVVIGILAMVGLSIVRNPVPSWIRTGIGGLGLGSLLLGLTWPYLLGPLDAAPGVLIEAIGAIALIGSGILAIVTDRHSAGDQPV